MYLCSLLDSSNRFWSPFCLISIGVRCHQRHYFNGKTLRNLRELKDYIIYSMKPINNAPIHPDLRLNIGGISLQIYRFICRYAGFVFTKDSRWGIGTGLEISEDGLTLKKSMAYGIFTKIYVALISQHIRWLLQVQNFLMECIIGNL